jgi:hypothetical protein
MPGGLRERHTAALAKADLVPVQRARPDGNESLNSVTGLPAPFGPRNPNTSPPATLNDTSDTAARPPKTLVR